jgi:hypothetical protein
MRRDLRARAALLAFLAAALVAGCGGSSGGGGSQSSTSGGGSDNASGVQLGPAFGSMDKLPGVLKTPPPWPANNDDKQLQLRLRAIGLDPLTAEGQAVHIHQHLDIYVDGKQQTLPAQVGIASSGSFISDLHTHDATGIMHVEAEQVRSFSLGQFFAVWGLRLDRNCLGSLCQSAGKQLRAFVNGKPIPGDPTRIVLAEHQEIVLAYGTAAELPNPIPKSFDFASLGL